MAASSGRPPELRPDGTWSWPAALALPNREAPCRRSSGIQMQTERWPAQPEANPTTGWASALQGPMQDLTPQRECQNITLTGEPQSEADRTITQHKREDSEAEQISHFHNLPGVETPGPRASKKSSSLWLGYSSRYSARLSKSHSFGN